jgi:hypothetical protein
MRRFKGSASWFTVGEPEALYSMEPVFPDGSTMSLVRLMFTVTGEDESVSLQSIGITFSHGSNPEALSALTAWYTGVVPGVPQRQADAGNR